MIRLQFLFEGMRRTQYWSSIFKQWICSRNRRYLIAQWNVTPCSWLLYNSQLIYAEFEKLQTCSAASSLNSIQRENSRAAHIQKLRYADLLWGVNLNVLIPRWGPPHLARPGVSKPLGFPGQTEMPKTVKLNAMMILRNIYVISRRVSLIMWI